MVVAMKAGVAIGFVAEPTVTALVAAGELEYLLAEYAITTSGLFLYYPSRRQVMPKLRVFIDYVQENLPKQWELMGLR
jgi:DNA-binding transcriptional LysR family regulator